MLAALLEDPRLLPRVHAGWPRAASNSSYGSSDALLGNHSIVSCPTSLGGKISVIGAQPTASLLQWISFRNSGSRPQLTLSQLHRAMGAWLSVTDSGIFLLQLRMATADQKCRVV